MSARAVRIIVVLICVAGVAGMIAASALDHNGAALTFGLVTAAAILCLMVATAVTAGPDTRSQPAGATFDAQAARVEQAVADLVTAGADEAAVRDLVREAVRLGRLDRERAQPP